MNNLRKKIGGNGKFSDDGLTGVKKDRPKLTLVTEASATFPETAKSLPDKVERSIETSFSKMKMYID